LTKTASLSAASAELQINRGRALKVRLHTGWTRTPKKHPLPAAFTMIDLSHITHTFSIGERYFKIF